MPETPPASDDEVDEDDDSDTQRKIEAMYKVDKILASYKPQTTGIMFIHGRHRAEPRRGRQRRPVRGGAQLGPGQKCILSEAEHRTASNYRTGKAPRVFVLKYTLLIL